MLTVAMLTGVGGHGARSMWNVVSTSPSLLSALPLVGDSGMGSLSTVGNLRAADTCRSATDLELERQNWVAALMQ